LSSPVYLPLTAWLTQAARWRGAIRIEGGTVGVAFLLAAAMIKNPGPASLTALLALARTDVILLWDPAVRTRIAANIVGTWIAPTGLTRVGDRVTR
jgi:hypothetical protein